METDLILSLLKRLATLLAALCSPVSLRGTDGMPWCEALWPPGQQTLHFPHPRAEGRGRRFAAIAARAVAGTRPCLRLLRATAARAPTPADAESDEVVPCAAAFGAASSRAAIPGVAGAAASGASVSGAAAPGEPGSVGSAAGGSAIGGQESVGRAAVGLGLDAPGAAAVRAARPGDFGWFVRSSPHPRGSRGHVQIPPRDPETAWHKPTIPPHLDTPTPRPLAAPVRTQRAPLPRAVRTAAQERHPALFGRSTAFDRPHWRCWWKNA